MEFKIEGIKKPIITETDENGCEIVVSHKGRWSSGYAIIRIGEKMRTAHQLVYEHLNGPIPNDLEVMHSCNVRDCVNPDHLRVGTHSENMQYAYDCGQIFTKKKCWLNPEEIEDIRLVPETRADKAAKHNVDVAQISRVVRGQAYRVHAYVNCKRVLLPERARYRGVPEWYGKPKGWLKKYKEGLR